MGMLAYLSTTTRYQPHTSIDDRLQIIPIRTFPHPHRNERSISLVCIPDCDTVTLTATSLAPGRCMGAVSVPMQRSPSQLLLDDRQRNRRGVGRIKVNRVLGGAGRLLGVADGAARVRVHVEAREVTRADVDADAVARFEDVCG